MHVTTLIALLMVISMAPQQTRVRMDATVTETLPGCFVCLVTVSGHPGDVVLTKRELNVETGGTAKAVWSETPGISGSIKYDVSCTVKPDGARAKVEAKINARKWPAAYSGSHVADVKTHRLSTVEH